MEVGVVDAKAEGAPADEVLDGRGARDPLPIYAHTRCQGKGVGEGG